MKWQLWRWGIDCIALWSIGGGHWWLPCAILREFISVRLTEYAIVTNRKFIHRSLCLCAAGRSSPEASSVIGHLELLFGSQIAAKRNRGRSLKLGRSPRARWKVSIQWENIYANLLNSIFRSRLRCYSQELWTQLNSFHFENHSLDENAKVIEPWAKQVCARSLRYYIANILSAIHSTIVSVTWVYCITWYECCRTVHVLVLLGLIHV